MSMNIDMKPCPFCGTKVSDSVIELEMNMTGVTNIRVRCECGADIMFHSDEPLRGWSGKEYQFGLDALDKWNRRPEENATE